MNFAQNQNIAMDCHGSRRRKHPLI